MPEPHLRASDTDREAVAAALGTHMAAGRLTLAEFDERVAQAYAARTYGELDALTADLPPLARTTAARPEESANNPTAPPPGTMVCGPPRTVAVPPPMTPWARHGHPEHSWRAWLSTSVTVLAVYLVISLASWDFAYFWPMWVIGPWGAALLAQRIGGHGAAAREERPRPDR